MAAKLVKLSLLIIFGVPLICVAVVLAWYGTIVVAYQQKWGWLEVIVHYRISFGVEVDGTRYDGSTVVQITYQDIPQWQVLFNPGIAAIYKGQAGCLTLPSGKLVCISPGAGDHSFYSSKQHNVGALADQLLSVRGSPTGPKSKWTAISAYSAPTVSGQADIPYELLPAIIMLDDPQNPSSAHLIDPRNPEPFLGNGSRFLGAQISVTKDPVSSQIERTLPWLANPKTPSMLSRRGDPFFAETHGQALWKSYFY